MTEDIRGDNNQEVNYISVSRFLNMKTVNVVAEAMAMNHVTSG